MTWKTTKNDGFSTVFWSFWVWIQFELSGQFCFSRHPWRPWGRQSSGVIWNETKISWFGHCGRQSSGSRQAVIRNSKDTQKALIRAAVNLLSDFYFEFQSAAYETESLFSLDLSWRPAKTFFSCYRDLTIGGYLIPKGVPVQMSLYSVLKGKWFHLN